MQSDDERALIVYHKLLGHCCATCRFFESDVFPATPTGTCWNTHRPMHNILTEYVCRYWSDGK